MALSSPRAAVRSPNRTATIGTESRNSTNNGVHVARANSSSSSSSSSTKVTHRPKVYLISDVHFDGQNKTFIEQMPKMNDGRGDSVLIVAGDVAEKIEDLERCLRLCLKKFDIVFYTFGNHDVWCTEDAEICSREKIDEVFKLCERLGVKTHPEEIANAVFIAPVHSWYEQEFDTEEDVEAPEGVSIPPPDKVMTDYRLCKWPKLDQWKKEMTIKIGSNSNNSSSITSTSASEGKSSMSDDYYISKAIDALNDEDGKFEQFLDNVKRAKAEGKDVTVITFSHFLPRIELIPEKRFLLYPKLTQAVGSNILNERLERVSSILHLSGKDLHTHAFGHTHFGWNLVLENNVRYVQSCLATPKEWVRRPRSLVVGEFFSNAPGNAPLLLYDAETNAFSGDENSSPSKNAEYNPGLWAKYYEENARDPSNKMLAPWVLSYVSRVWGSRELKKSMMMASNADDLPGKSGKV